MKMIFWNVLDRTLSPRVTVSLACILAVLLTLVGTVVGYTMGSKITTALYALLVVSPMLIMVITFVIVLAYPFVRRYFTDTTPNWP